MGSENLIRASLRSVRIMTGNAAERSQMPALLEVFLTWIRQYYAVDQVNGHHPFREISVRLLV